ncbi:MAG: hypothetical protein CVV51_02285 [Spirochaetae bacterium HGW-Spirochaetae-7]|nr:MAG: hypothetical protein CVV51_02285 [Spirochaetae bacterium HGW-Spirochaetae-7]
MRLLPPIRRARGNRLYAADGRRYLDLWLDDGRGMLGDGDRHARTFAANAADKGLTRPYPGLYDKRFERAIRETWPGFVALRLFSSEERALAAAAGIVGSANAGSAGSSVVVARPFAPVPDDVEVAIPRLPCPRPFSPFCVMARSEDLFAGEPGDLVPAQSLVAAARGLASLQTAIREGYGEALWSRFDRRLAEFFDRCGPYLSPKPFPGGLEAFFKAALEGGALVSPRPDAPSVIPPDFDDGELAKLAKALAKGAGD